MSGVMSMFSNMFGSGSSGAAAPTTPAAPTGTQNGAPTPGNIPDTAAGTGVSNPNTAPNGILPGNEGSNTPAEATPLDSFKDLWNNDPVDSNAAPTGVFNNVDPKKFMEAAGKIDFTKVITPEQMTAISQGGEGAVQAFAAALNKVAQTTYAQSAFATTKIVEQAMARGKDTILSELPQHIKKHTVSENLRAENPVFQNPAVQPVISALEAQLTVKYPRATAGEITQMAKQYVEALGTSFSPKPAAPANADENDTNWDEFFG